MALIVNGERIEEEAVREEAERMRPRFEEAFGDDEPQAREARLQEWARENVVEQALLRQEALADPEPIPPGELAEVVKGMAEQLGIEEADERLEQEVELRMRMQRVLDRLASGVPEPSDEAVQQHYDDHTDEFMAPEQVHVAHIVKNVGPGSGPAEARAELEQVKAELDGGADFAEMAARHSDCPDNGGDLGCFPRGQMVEEFEHIVFSMRVGALSEVFASRFGFHIAKLLERKPPAPVPLDQVRDAIREQLLNDARGQAVEKHLNGLRMKATVKDE